MQKVDFGSFAWKNVFNEIKLWFWPGLYWLLVWCFVGVLLQSPFLYNHSASSVNLPYMVGEVLGEIVVAFLLPYVVVLILRLAVKLVRVFGALFKDEKDENKSKNLPRKKTPWWLGILLFALGYALLWRANMNFADGEFAQLPGQSNLEQGLDIN